MFLGQMFCTEFYCQCYSSLPHIASLSLLWHRQQHYVGTLFVYAATDTDEIRLDITHENTVKHRLQERIKAPTQIFYSVSECVVELINKLALLSI